MKDIKFCQIFGVICGDGTLALNFLNCEVLPALTSGDHLLLDFKGVRVLNSSFSNALFGNLIKLKGKEIVNQLSICNACDLVKSEIKSAINYAIKPV